MLGQNGYLTFMTPIDIMLQKGHSSYQKYHPTKMAPHKKLGAKCESYDKFKNSLLKITQFSPWQIISGYFFARSAIFGRHHFLWVSYLSISGGVFVMCHFCKVPLFSNRISVCLFCWVPFFIKQYFLGFSNCNYLLFYQ